ncbi:MAG: alpha-ketoacid dehydrogenase subunit beta [Bdellovibrionaceae bacterium]|nr:alpha-ketoacid dehydrogenase subunit beta [Pseudobdellovibrionaceae bacterium]
MANMAQAIRMALHYAEENYQLHDVFGQDVGAPLGGVFTATQGIQCAWNSPLDERGIIGMAIGIGMAGKRCVAEIQFADYIFNTMDLLKLAGNMYWASHGQYSIPIVVMTPVGAGIRGSIYHSHSFDSWASRLPGWKIVLPSNPLDAYGLLLSSILDPNPVLFLPPKALMRVKGKELIPGEPEDEKELKAMIDAPIGDRTQWKPRWPRLKEYLIPLGKGRIVKEGNRVTLVTWGRYVGICEQVIDDLIASAMIDSTDVELIDLRSIYPYDWPLIKESVKKTRKVLFVNEDTEVTNFAEHLSYRVTKELFYELWAPPQVIAGRHVPGIGLHPNLEDASVPGADEIKKVIIALIQEVP